MSATLHGAAVVLIGQACQWDAPQPAPAQPDPPAIVYVLPPGFSPDGPAHAPSPAAIPAGTPAAQAVALARVNRDPFDRRFVPGTSLDIGPVPAVTPDFTSAMKNPVSAGRVRLRVYVSAFGLPDRVEVLGHPLDQEFARALCRALEQTSFLPGRRNGRDVAAYVDYEFHADLVELSAPVNRRSS